MPTFETLDIAVDGPIATLMLNRPARLNALSRLLLRELVLACRWFDEEATDVKKSARRPETRTTATS